MYLRVMLPESIHGKRILISCLNWGFGHVARCLPIIQQLKKQGNKIFFAGSVEQQMIISSYFDNVIFIEHTDYPFKFSGKGNFGTDLLKSYFPLTKRIKSEQREVEYYVKKHEINLVISDHRYGFYSKQCLSICLVHQLNLPLKWYQWGGQVIHRRLLRKFDMLWIPDTSDSQFAGKLSRNKANFNVEYIGPQSRFSLYEPMEKSIDEVIVLSGPTIYAQLLLDQLASTKDKSVHFIGSEHLNFSKVRHYTISNNWKACDQLILKAKKITSRSGYSTIMDLAILKAEYDLYATLGQVEQVYLLQIHKK